jgi:hypothetical protein
MLEALFWILVGAFIGWHVDQPAWAKSLKEKVLSIFSK